jgi:ABC-type branched-subunit amino acid transport system ATPase component
MSATLEASAATPGDAPVGDVLLQARGIDAGYNKRPIVHGLDLVVRRGEVTVLLGPNGAGKTTTLMSLCGELPLLGGSVEMYGQTVRSPLHRRARAGLAVVTEERCIFSGLTTMENLRLGRGDIPHALALFPELETRLHNKAGMLSGGEQQMLVMARALSRRPKLLVVDEVSLGLAPLAVQRLFQAIRQAADSGVGVLLVEQHVRQVLRIADHAYVMQRGRVELAGTAAEVTGRLSEIEDSYLS